MEYGYTHKVGGTPNGVGSTPDPSLIGSRVLSMRYGGFPIVQKGNPFTPWERRFGIHPTTCSKYLHNSRVLSYLNYTLSIQGVIINMLLFRVLTQDHVIAM